MMDESGRLLTTQQTLEKEADGKINFFGLSVNDTLRTLILNGMSKRADRIKSDFKVPDKRYATFTPTYHLEYHLNLFALRFWYVKLHALVECRDFEGLDAFARSRRSPIGYPPFVRH